MQINIDYDYDYNHGLIIMTDNNGILHEKTSRSFPNVVLGSVVNLFLEVYLPYWTVIMHIMQSFILTTLI